MVESAGSEACASDLSNSRRAAPGTVTGGLGTGCDAADGLLVGSRDGWLVPGCLALAGGGRTVPVLEPHTRAMTVKTRWGARWRCR